MKIADFAELVCWQQKSTSIVELSAKLGRLAENDYSIEGVPEDDLVPDVVGEAFQEIEKRMNACGDGYPFEFGGQGQSLNLRSNVDNHRNVIYKYLLLATRLNMNENRNHAGINGALLLEELAADVAQEYLGARAKKFVFGTAVKSSGFEEKVNLLCQKMNEGIHFVNRDQGPPLAQDGKT